MYRLYVIYLHLTSFEQAPVFDNVLKIQFAERLLIYCHTFRNICLFWSNNDARKNRPQDSCDTFDLQALNGKMPKTGIVDLMKLASEIYFWNLVHAIFVT